MPDLPLRDGPASATAASGKRRFSSTTTSGRCRRRCVCRTRSPAWFTFAVSAQRRKVLFSQSTYSLSMRMAHDVGYWDTDIIPEDWHMFLKCFYNLGGNVEVVPIHLPVGNDGALSHTVKGTFINHYLQVRRWGWGASDIPFAAKEAMQHGDISLHRRLARLWYLVDNHLSWSTQWFFITLGGFVPWTVLQADRHDDPAGVAGARYVTGIDAIPDWVTIGSVILAPCIVPYIIMIVLDARMRPAPPTPAR